MEYLKTFDYHCGHCFKTFSDISTAIFMAEGQAAAAEVLRRFGEAYGRDMADKLTEYKDMNFDLI